MVQPHPPGSGGGPSRSGHSTPGGGSPSAVNIGLVVLAGLLLLGVLTGGGRETAGQVFGFLVFYCGVFTLVSLTLTVILGLVATDRIILVARHRVWAQSVHRTLGIVAVCFLGLHIGTELMAGRVGLFGALIPFTTAPFTIGAGTVAAYLMTMVMWTGIVRSRFAGNGRPWLWRPLHATAYLSWPVALWHGLNAGRPAAVWVTASYLILGFLTTVALGLRLSAERGRRRQQLAADRTTTEIAPVGRPEPVGYERRASRGRSGGRFRWDAPPADQLWRDADADLRTGYRGVTDDADLRADYRRAAQEAVPVPVTAIPVTAVAYPTETYEPTYEPQRETYYEEPAPTYRGTATPVSAAYDDYDPYATYDGPRYEEPRYEEPRYEEPAYNEAAYRDEQSGMTLRDRFAARRAAAAAVAEADRYADDDTPTLVNLDTRRELRRVEREQREQQRQEQERQEQARQQTRRGRRRRADDDDADYFSALRGEAR